MFLWAVIAVREVRDGLEGFVDLTELTQTVDALPSQLESLFMLMLNRIKPASQRDAARFLQIALALPPIANEFILRQHDLRMTLCRLHFIRTQKGFEDVPIAHDEVSMGEVIKVCEALKIQVLSHTEGLLDLTPENEFCSSWGQYVIKDLLLHAQVNFIHRTARDFLRYNDQAKTFLARKGFSEAELHLCIARGTLSYVAHFAEGDFPTQLDINLTAYGYFYHTLEQISKAEKHTNVVQRNLVRSLNYDLYVPKYAGTKGKEKTYSIYQDAFYIDSEASSLDVVGLAANMGMTLFTCERLGLSLRLQDYTDLNQTQKKKFAIRETSTLRWVVPDSKDGRIRIRQLLLHAPDYRQALRQHLRPNPSPGLNEEAHDHWTNIAFAESYLLACCVPFNYEVVRILLRAGANPMVHVIWAGETFADHKPREHFWQRWILFLQTLRSGYIRSTGRSGGIRLDDVCHEYSLTYEIIFDITKLLLANGADVSHPLPMSSSRDWGFFLKRDLRRLGQEFDLVLEATAMFTLEECFGKDPAFAMVSKMASSVKTPRELIRIQAAPSVVGNGYDVVDDDTHVPLGPEESATLWPLIAKWEASGHSNDLKVLDTALV